MGLFGKAAFKRGITAQELLALRFLIGSLIVACIQSARLGPRSLKINGRTLGLCFILGIGGYALFSSFYFMAIEGLSASVAVLLLYTFPIWVAIGAWIFLSEPIEKEKIWVIPLAFIGLIFLAWGEVRIAGLKYIVMGMLSAILYAVYILISRRYLKGEDPFTCVVYIQLFGHDI